MTRLVSFMAKATGSFEKDPLAHNGLVKFGICHNSRHGDDDTSSLQATLIKLIHEYGSQPVGDVIIEDVLC